MGISFQCESCGARFKVANELAGRKAKCNKCGAIVIVPAAGVEEAPLPVEPIQPVPYPDAAPRFAPAPPFAPAQDFPEAEPVPMAESLPMARRAPSGGALAAERSLASVKGILDRGDYLGATQALQQAGPDAKNHPGFFFLAGLAYAGLGNYPHALDSLTQAIHRGVRNPTAYAAKGKAELALSQYPAAIESLDTALDLAGTDVPDYMADLARAYEGAGMRQDAAATWNALAQISPNHPALLQRKREREEQLTRKNSQDVQTAMLQMQKEQRASDTACWICIILRILLECM